ncbi:MAG TPA: AAA family ATPase [Candidatus Saccharimonadales bacterium]|jgi:DNA polymerase-3 subunit delta'|nr:AAA family ATPase [Candidatus Saccharimonadales bacterium]
MSTPLHPKTAEQLQHFLVSPAHAILLVGPAGIGKGSLATALTKQLLDLDEHALGSYQYLTRLEAKGDSISIETVRDLQHFLQLRTIGDRPIRRVAIIEYADRMTTEAQNALLKMLEEPPADTVLVLTANNTHALLATILSRLQRITVREPLEAELRAYFAKTHDSKAIDQAYFLSGGLPGLMQALLEGTADHPLFMAVGQAKALLQQPTFDRLVAVDALSKKKDDVVHVLYALLRIAQTGMVQAGKRGDQARVKRWYQIVTAIHATLETLAVHGNTKLALTNLMLSM